MDSAEYWRKRALEIKNKAMVRGEDYEFEMAKRLAKASRDIDDAITVWLKKYADEDGTITIDEAQQLLRGIENKTWQSTLDEWERKAKAGGYEHELDLEYYRSRISRLEALQAELKNILAGYAKPEQLKMLGVLMNTYEDTYYRTVFNAQSQNGTFTADFAHFDPDALQHAVSKPWFCTDFSQKVWGNMVDTLPNMLQDAVARSIALGYGPTKITRELNVTFRNFKKYELHRLITTELAHATEEATAKAYEESGVEKYEYLATLEAHTCEICGELDGKVFEVSEREEGVNYPVMHPYCRCTTVPYVEELEDFNTTRWARNPKTGKGERIQNMTFKEWQAEYVDGSR